MKLLNDIIEAHGGKNRWNQFSRIEAQIVLIGHPFNPPHLIPLVEIVPGKRTSKKAVAEAVQFYTAIGKRPVVMPG